VVARAELPKTSKNTIFSKKKKQKTKKMVFLRQIEVGWPFISQLIEMSVSRR